VTVFSAGQQQLLDGFAADLRQLAFEVRTPA